MKSFLASVMLCFSVATLLQAQTPCVNGMAGIYPCNQVDLMSTVSLFELGGIENMNDVWGWTDTDSGREFALVGLNNGTSFVEVTDPLNPVVIGTLDTHTTSSLWRDIKVYDNHAFIVSEASAHGMQIFDLELLLPPYELMPVTFQESAHYPMFGSAHNIAINEDTGFAYGIGTGTFQGGLQFVDVSDPLNPQIAGGFAEDGYTHDAQIVTYNGPDEDYIGREIAFNCNEDAVTIVDVTDKQDPQILSITEYENSSYTHQGWLTDDGKYFLFNDELDELDALTVNTKTFILNVEDLDNPFLHFEYIGPTTAIDHNLYNDGSLCYQSDYRAGIRIVDIGNIPEQDITEVAFFDSQPSNDFPSFQGTWSNYVYFPSGTVIMTDMYSDFFVLRPTITNAYRYASICPDAEQVEYYIDVTYEDGDMEVFVTNDIPNTSVEIGDIVSNGSIPITLNISDVLVAGEYDIPVEVSRNGEVVYSDNLRLIVDEELAFTGLSPASGFDAGESDVNISWDAIDGVETYQLLVSDSDDFSNTIVNEEITGTSYTFEGEFQGEYFWQISAMSPCGFDQFSEVSSFTNFFFGVEEYDSVFKLYPNPAKEFVTVKDYSGALQLLTADGKLITELRSNGSLEIDITGFPVGIYFIRELNSNTYERFIKE